MNKKDKAAKKKRIIIKLYLRYPTALARLVYKQLKKIRAKYKKASAIKNPSGFAEWLCDNYYLIEENAKNAIRSIKNEYPLYCLRGKRLPLIYELLRQSFVKSGAELTGELLIDFLRKSQEKHIFTTTELNFLQTALRAVLLDICCKACFEKKDEALAIQNFSYGIESLRSLSDIDFEKILDEVSYVEKLLLKDPAGIYAKMDSESKNQYRYKISKIARQKEISETDTASAILDKARDSAVHIGKIIWETDGDAKRCLRKGSTALRLALFLPLVASFFTAFYFRAYWTMPLIYLAFYEIMRPVLEHFALRGVECSHIPALELKDGIDPEYYTLVAISTILPEARDKEKIKERLEDLYFKNKDDNIGFLILADYKEANAPNMPEDKIQLKNAMESVQELNEIYGQRFFLMVRKRSYNSRSKVFSGWERKRGATIELVRLIKGEETRLDCFAGDREKLAKARYLISLDSDTEILLDSVKALVGAAAHPLNAPEINPQGKIVERGYGIIAPQISTSLKSAFKTPFAKIMAGAGGISSYDNGASNFYQDLFGAAIFTGKGLLDINVYYKLMDRRFEDNIVLSHDILEGSFMRTAFLSQVEMLDSFPSAPIPYFARLHRWVRGDWQNIGYARRRLKNGRLNEMTAADRYKIFDNIRRSLLPVSALACLIAAAFANGAARWILLAASFLTVTFPFIYSAFMSIWSGGFFALSREYYSGAHAQAADMLAQAFVNLIFMPYHAWTCLDAAVRSLYRMFISKKKLLEWTTASASNSKKYNFAQLLSKFWFPELLGILALAFSPGPLIKAWGALFLLVPFFSAGLSVEYKSALRESSAKDKAALISYASAMWGFFEGIFSAEDNYLPPDNIQEVPSETVAHRTSPTNIGLMLLSFLAARDMGFIDVPQLFDKVNKTMDTVIKLPKWNGNLYNWYDTRNLRILQRYVSSVDSGNFVCCLVALRQGLKEYVPDTAVYYPLLKKINTVIDETDLSVFYNKRKKLFAIGYDEGEGKLSNSHYDLLMSEARLTSYYAIAQRQAPKKHWGSLSRTMARVSSYAAPLSWSGTMFEYYMPNLLLPSQMGSLNYEALNFCYYCQKKDGIARSRPWGVSESGFYAFDSNLNYQYKAHGVQKLGLRRGLSKDNVISPYSSFLIAPYNLREAVKNLRRIRALGAYGKYGFYEAVDFTKNRVRNIQNRDYAIVRSYMSHHVGMSFISADNALNEKIMQKRFMRDKTMRAAKELLEEKIVNGAVLYDGASLYGSEEKKKRASPEVDEFRDISPLSPRIQLLANDEWSVAISDCGASDSLLRGINVTKCGSDLLNNPQGIFVYVGDEREIFPVTAAPEYRKDIEYVAKFTPVSAEFFAKHNGIEAGVQVMVSASHACEQRTIVVRNKTAKKTVKEIFVYFEPCLAKKKNDEAHPIYSKLFINAEYDKGSGAVICERRPSAGGGRLCLAAGFLEKIGYKYELSKEKILDRPYGTASLSGLNKKEFSAGPAIPDAAAAFRFKAELDPNEQKDFHFIITAAETRDAALSQLLMARLRGALDYSGAAKSPLMVNTTESQTAKTIIPYIICPGRERNDEKAIAAAHENERGVNGLWGLAVSGDYPIILLPIEKPDPVFLDNYLKAYKILRLRNINCDLVITFRDKRGAENLSAEIKKLIDSNAMTFFLGQPSGIHPVDLELHDAKTEKLLYAAAAYVAEKTILKEAKKQPFSPLKITPTAKYGFVPESGVKTLGGVFHGKRFYITAETKAPWCHILANPAFGTLVSDKALGYTWAVNSRENKLTPWNNDRSRDNRGEMLLLRLGGEYIDLINGAQVSYSERSAVYTGKKNGIATKAAVSVSETGCSKYCEVLITNEKAEDETIECVYYTEPVLGVSRGTSGMIRFETSEKTLLLHNPFGQIKGFMGLSCSRDEAFFMNDRSAVLEGRLEKSQLLEKRDNCAAVVVPLRIRPKAEAGIRFILSYGKDRAACIKMAKMPYSAKPAFENSVKIRTPDPCLDVMINQWLPHQTLSSRIRGRTGFYQCGGAWGFRDQLQDVCSLLTLSPKLARQHIIRCAKAQFEEGDALHWWHQMPDGKRGVRTRCSDDLLWLVYAVCEYVEKTGDFVLLDLELPYLSGKELEPGEHERYFEPRVSPIRESIYYHCKKSVKRSMNFGKHGLPLIGNGDWNDSFNKAGINGRGESVWLAQFMALTLNKFAALCDGRGDREYAYIIKNKARDLLDCVDKYCFEEDRYIRAFYDDGSKMGSAESDECKIDILSQSFAVLSGMKNRERISKAIDTAYNSLVDFETGIIKLFAPPFDKSDHEPGYVKAYPAGTRENGGQYTHAAIWFALALLEKGEWDKAYGLIQTLNPARKYLDEKTAGAYMLEPYYMAADIYSNKNAAGRGGWSLYTGASGWYYRLVVEYMLGLKMRPGRLEFEPKIPLDWPGFSMEINISGTAVKVEARRREGRFFILDDERRDRAFVPLDGREHVVKIGIL
ncbi:MAG: hypothetical protein LBC56_02080 [Oscillospiraceae bacterium]|nr:hypothetical protein [Oscillospiraceae bacterium]